jgi:hypothetical protein
MPGSGIRHLDAASGEDGWDFRLACAFPVAEQAGYLGSAPPAVTPEGEGDGAYVPW